MCGHVGPGVYLGAEHELADGPILVVVPNLHDIWRELWILAATDEGEKITPAKSQERC